MQDSMTARQLRQDAETPAESDPEVEYRRVHRSARSGDSVVRFGGTPFGGEGFTVIAGPCAVESAEQIDRSAAIVAEHGGGVLRGGAFKPRTSPYSFQGLGMEGVEMMRRAADAHDIPLVTEVMSPERVEEMAPLVDAFQLGARNMQNFDLLRAIGASGVPVLLKRGFGVTLREWLLAAEYVMAEGNDQVVLCERGIRTFNEETRFTLDFAGAAWVKEQTHLPVVIDPSHATGKPEIIPKMVYAAIAAGFDGAMVEVHPNPAEARSDADQALTVDQYADLMDRVSVLTEAIAETT
jgi:3-deoxy-7-phosphoheptulonate synthase